MRGRPGRFPQRGGQPPAPQPQGPLRPGEVLAAPGQPAPEFIFEGPPPVPTPLLPKDTVKREAPKGKGERHTVLEANQGFYDALEARDIALMSKVWAQDGTVRCTQPNGVLLRGWEEVRRTFEQLFSADRPYKIELTQVYSEEADAIAYVSLVERVEMPQTTRPRREHVATNVFRLEKGVWKLVLHHTT
jgi:ketosteroid isomerase-like protein